MKYLITALLCLSTAILNAEELDPPEIVNGERLFIETRFAQFFYQYLENGGDTNKPMQEGDPVLNKTVRFFGLPPYQIPFTDSPYAGQSINCRTCHMVDEHVEQSELGMRAYSDFAARSPVPTREDKQTTVVRNSPSLVHASIARNNFIMHSDGEFSSLKQLIIDTLAGRNFGWIPGEKQLAINHVCRIIKEDNGNNDLAKEFGELSYTEMFSGTTNKNTQVNQEFLLPDEYRVNVNKASCDEVYEAVVTLIAAYTEDLIFANDEEALSPYDIFLKVNSLPTQANENETDLAYSKRLLAEIDSLKKSNKLKLIEKNPNTEDGKFKFHDPDYKFGEEELLGLEVFFNQDPEDDIGTGNCIACHAAPHFTDFGLHNIGITQIEYDNIHGFGKFAALNFPTLKQREKNPNVFLPATEKHPKRKGIFRRPASQENPAYTDLGAWNIFFNTDYPLPQESIYNLICLKNGEVICKSREDALSRSLASFKTPSLRDLGHSAPYMHNGQISDLHAVVGFYLAASISTRNEQFRNPDEDIAKIDFKPKDVIPLTLFLISLYEDYN
jgi:cytochrome c peroxidase